MAESAGVATVNPSLRDHLNGHTDRFNLQKISGKEVRVVPGTKRQERGRISVEVIWDGEGGSEPIRARLCTKFLLFGVQPKSVEA